MADDGRVSISIDSNDPPYVKIQLQGQAEVIEDDPPRESPAERSLPLRMSVLPRSQATCSVSGCRHRLHFTARGIR